MTLMIRLAVLNVCVALLLTSMLGETYACEASDLLEKAADSEQYRRWIQPSTIPVGPDATFGPADLSAWEEAKSSWIGANAKIGFAPPTNANVTFIGFGGKFPPARTTIRIGQDPYIDASSKIEVNDNSGITWTYMCPTEGYDLPTVLVHELGHYIGLLQHDPSNCTTDQTVMKYAGDKECDVTPGPIDAAALSILYPDNPAAEATGFVVVDGVARWFTESTLHSAAMVVEGSYGKDGPWSEVYRTEPRVGQDRATVGASGFTFFRLVEEEVSGRRLNHGIAASGSSTPGPMRKDDRFVGADRSSSATRSKRARVLPWPTGGANSMSIYTPSALSATVTARIADHWVANGYQVTVNQTDGFPADPDGFRSALKAAIAAEAAGGTQYFLLAGDANDYAEFSTPWPGEWETIRQDRIAAGYPPGGQPERDLIPTFVVPDTVSRDLSMSWFSPYWFSDLPYADTNDDGIPDVVVGRLPAASSSEVDRYGTKLALGIPWNSDRVGFLVGDRKNIVGASGDSLRAVETARELISGLPPWTQIDSLYWTDRTWPDYNAAGADFVNAFEPDLLVLISSFSTRYVPGDFFDKTLGPPYDWTMDRLATSNMFFVIGGSCAAADFARTERPLYGAPSHQDFLFDTTFVVSGRGALAWMGPTAGTWQSGNRVVVKYLLEELYRAPYQPAGGAFLRAIQRVLSEYPAESNVGKVARSYVYLGDPLIPFSSIPETSVSAWVNPSGGGDPMTMPDAVAVGCPAGDRDEITIDVVISGADLSAPVPQNEIGIVSPSASGIVFSDVQSSAMTQLPSGDWKTSFAIPAFSGCGIDSALITLYGAGVAFAPLNVRSFDTAQSVNEPIRSVDILDFSEFGSRFPSSVCDCVYQQTYSSCSDYAPPADTLIDLLDWSIFGEHFGHAASAPPLNSGDQIAKYSNGQIRVTVTEEAPLLGSHILRVDVSLTAIEPSRTALLSFRIDNPALSFGGWDPDSSDGIRTLCTTLSRDGHREVMLGVIAETPFEGSLRLGSFEIDLNAGAGFELSEEDLSVAIASLLDAGGTVRLFRVSPANSRIIQRARYTDTLAQNYPNPFNPVTTVAFSLGRPAHVKLVVFDVTGARVRTLLDEARATGNHRIVWDGKDDYGNGVASGVFFYRIKTDRFSQSRKMVLLR